MATRRFAWVAGVVASLVCVGIAYGAYMLADYSWNQVVDYQSPYASFDRDTELDDSPSESTDTSTTPRVVFVLIDGLTVQGSRDHMGALNMVREYGADMVAHTSQPSLSYPMWTNTVTGSPPDISGVTTNWFEGPVGVETLFDVVYPRKIVVSGSEDFEDLYGISQVAEASHLEPWDDTQYLSGIIVDKAIEMTEDTNAALIFVYLPDPDTVAHDNGPESEEYAEVLSRVDFDLGRLIDGLQDERTMFVVTADHGHIDGGGHGGWEPQATRVPAVLFGPGTRYDTGDIEQSDLAPTIAAFLGEKPPAQTTGRVLDTIVEVDEASLARAERSYRSFAEEYARIIDGTPAGIGGASTYDEVDLALSDLRDDRMMEGQAARLPQALVVAGIALAVLLAIGLLSWRALVAALAGTAVYYATYDGLYFLLHGHQWSLSAFNTESFLQTFFNIRMIEAAVAGLVAALVAGFVYPYLRRRPRGSKREYAGGWISLGSATVLAIEATLAFQVAWFLWAWGAEVTWRLPDLMWGFKYDLDLIQMTALGAAAVLAPVVTFLVGRYHPRVRRSQAKTADEPSVQA